MPPKRKHQRARPPGQSPGTSTSGSRARSPGGPAPAAPTHRSVATWTVVSERRPVSWASRTRWSAQPRPLRTDDPTKAPLPFRGLTLTDRPLNDPPIPIAEEERRLLCPLCGVPEIHRSAHRRGPLHKAKQQPAHRDVAAALATLRRLRPDLLKASPPTQTNEDIVLKMSDDEL
ncbi:uncharacterized protein LOC135372914 [Ornithodoros turicata]|uniref:uncharacterized protein LOC135372914 n=1 Tax=Ornithodoros turicata TaxID=34597 RepID=UPI0031396CA0